MSITSTSDAYLNFQTVRIPYAYLLFGILGDKSAIQLQRDACSLPVMSEPVVVATVLVEMRSFEEEQVLGAPLRLEIACAYAKAHDVSFNLHRGLL